MIIYEYIILNSDIILYFIGNCATFEIHIIFDQTYKQMWHFRIYKLLIIIII